MPRTLVRRAAWRRARRSLDAASLPGRASSSTGWSIPDKGTRPQDSPMRPPTFSHQLPARFGGRREGYPFQSEWGLLGAAVRSPYSQFVGQYNRTQYLGLRSLNVIQEVLMSTE